MSSDTLTSERPAVDEVAPVDKSETRVRRMFSEIAGRYDLLNHLLSLNIDRYWRWRTVQRIPPLDSAPILDLCTGTGDLAIAYTKASQKSTTVIGADFCHEMLAIGREKGRRAGQESRLKFVEADAQSLPFPNDYFQIVSVAFGLRNVTNTERGLREMVRVCKPGGHVAVLEFSAPTLQPFKAIYSWYFWNVLPRIGQALARNRHSAYEYLPASVQQFPAGKQFANMLEAAGLKRVRFYPMTLGVATLYVGQK